MDGHFVPNITIGPPVVRAIKRVATRPLDVHLMIEEPDRYIEAFIAAGASMISVHVEAVPHLHRTVHFIKKLGAQAGVVLNPATPAAALEDIAGDVDYVLVMSVNPGFGGQAFIRHSLEKLRSVRAVLDRARSSAVIEIDGGIDLSNVGDVVSAGASILVAGNAIFGTPDPEARPAPCAPPQWAPRPGHERLVCERHNPPDAGAGAVCRNRPHGRRLLRQLPGVVRGGPHRVAPHHGVELPRDGARRDLAAGDRGALRVPPARRGTTTRSRFGRARPS